MGINGDVLCKMAVIGKAVLRIRIRCFLDPWIRIRDGKKSGSGMKISYDIFESLVTLARS
jgi:hypothetical protein